MSIDLSLDRVKALVTQFEVYTRPTVHISGTNGKGSVSALLVSIFKHAGLSVGRFNSPHLVHPSDSISLNGTPISRELFAETMDEVQKTNEEHAIKASNFEVLTMCALLVFERAGVDVVLLEVGMGGRLDATNVISDDCILASVITAIDLDHQAFLGPTVEAIAREKAGIIRKGRPVVLAVQKYENVYAVVKEVAQEHLAPLVLAPNAKERHWDEEIDGECLPPFSLRPFAPDPPVPVEVRLPRLDGDLQEASSGSSSDTDTTYRTLLPLHGSHQLGNLGAALAVLRVLRSQAISSPTPSTAPSQKSLRNGLSSRSIVHMRLAHLDEKSIHAAVRETVWPGRLSFHVYHPDSPSLPNEVSPSTLKSSGKEKSKRTPLVVLVDGAHNEAGARALSTYLSSLLSSLGKTRLSSGNTKKRGRLRLTFILALSHSPPKTPESVLVPLLVPFLNPSQDPAKRSWEDDIDLKTRIALVRFSPPEGMPWIKFVPPSTMHEVICASFPGDRKLVCWVAPDSKPVKGQTEQHDLRDALRWAAESHGEEVENYANDEESMVLVAGSLYLVADFYRLLQLRDSDVMKN